MIDKAIQSAQRNLQKKLKRHEPALRKGLALTHSRELGREFLQGMLEALGGGSLAADVSGTYGTAPASPAGSLPRRRGRPSKQLPGAAAGRGFVETTPSATKRTRRGRIGVGGKPVAQSAG